MRGQVIASRWRWRSTRRSTSPRTYLTRPSPRVWHADWVIRRSPPSARKRLSNTSSSTGRAAAPGRPADIRDVLDSEVLRAAHVAYRTELLERARQAELASELPSRRSYWRARLARS